MQKPLFIALVLAIATLNSGHAPVNLSKCQPDAATPQMSGVEAVLAAYLAAVDRGELWSFGRRLARSDIMPVRVQFDYSIADGTMDARVYSNLKEPMPVPEQPEYLVVGVCSMVKAGRIVETESHVLLK